MSAEALRWLGSAEENRRAAELCLQANLFNPCLQNAQQAVEKALKALHLGSGLTLKKTHSIGELRRDLLRAKVDPGPTADAADLLDTIYLPSKYPLGSVLPDFEADARMAQHCVMLANEVLAAAGERIPSE